MVNVRIATVLEGILNGLSDLVYPPNCLLCKKYCGLRSPVDFLCPHCFNSIQFNLPPFCLKCSRPLGGSFQYPKCRECRLKKTFFDFAWGACLYHEPLRQLIHLFKYDQKTFLRFPFHKLLVNFIETYHFDIAQFDTLVPIPLYSARLRERGYNQSEIIAGGIAQKFNLGISSHNLIRMRPTPSQTILSQKERWTNLEGAFRIKHSKEFHNKNVLIIDDLLTTGATASEAACVLKLAGAKTVGVLTLAIASLE